MTYVREFFFFLDFSIYQLINLNDNLITVQVEFNTKFWIVGV